MVVATPTKEPKYNDVDVLYNALQGLFGYVVEKNDDTDAYNRSLIGSPLNEAERTLAVISGRYKFDPPTGA